MNNELREKEISRDYHLKRAIIYSLIFNISPFLTVGNIALFIMVIYPFWEGKIESDPKFSLGDNSGKRFFFLTPEEENLKNELENAKEEKIEFAKKMSWAGWIILELLITLLPLALTIYHFYKFWKAYKECQELANPPLTSETERERERAK